MSNMHHGFYKSN